MSQAALDQIKELNHAYYLITGEDAYQYTTQPGLTTKFVFNTSTRTFTNAGDALTHMTEVLDKARDGWTHNEIMYGKQRQS